MKFLYIFSEENIKGTPLNWQSSQMYPLAKYGRREFSDIIVWVFLLPHKGQAIISIVSSMLCYSIAYI